jgi:hypothetical protein
MIKTICDVSGTEPASRFVLTDTSSNRSVLTMDLCENCIDAVVDTLRKLKKTTGKVVVELVNVKEAETTPALSVS